MKKLVFCSTAFWDTNLTKNYLYPDLTICFQDSVLSFIPSLYLILTLPFYIYYLTKYGKTHKPYFINSLASIKIICAILLCVITIADLILRMEKLLWTGTRPEDTTITLISISSFLFPALLVFSYASMSFLLYYERKNGIWSSAYTFNFWVLCICYLTIYVWSQSLTIKPRQGQNVVMPNYALYVTQLVLVILELFLHSFNAKSRTGFDSNRTRFMRSKFGSSSIFKLSKSSSVKEDALLDTEENIKLTDISTKKMAVLKPCPEIFASFLSRITFCWFDKLAVYGSKHPLNQSDLWTLSDDNTSNQLYPLFANNWYPYLDRLKLTAFNKYLKKRKIKCPAYQLNESLLRKSSNNNGSHLNNTTSSFKILNDKKPKQQHDGIFTTSSTHPNISQRKNSERKMSKEDFLTLFDNFNTKNKISPSLAYVLYRCFRLAIFQSILYKLVNDLCTFLNPIILRHLILFVKERRTQSIWIGFFYALAMLASSIFHTLVLHKYFDIVFQLGLKIKTILICAVYRKALRLSSTARKASTVGEIVNLMSVDTQKVTDVCAYMSLLWSSPLQIGVCMIFLWNIMGPSVLSGLLVMVLLIPLNGILANMTKKLQTTQMKLKDERIKVMNEVLNGIKVLKLYAWELSFEDKILKIREKEIAILRRIALINAITSFVWSCAPFMVSCITFATYLLSSPTHIFNAEKAFVALALFNILRFPLTMLPMIITYVIEAKVSLKRLRNFLLQDELNPDIVTRLPMDYKEENDRIIDIQIINGNFSWDPEESSSSPDNRDDQKGLKKSQTSPITVKMKKGGVETSNNNKKVSNGINGTDVTLPKPADDDNNLKTVAVPDVLSSPNASTRAGNFLKHFKTTHHMSSSPSTRRDSHRNKGKKGKIDKLHGNNYDVDDRKTWNKSSSPRGISKDDLELTKKPKHFGKKPFKIKLHEARFLKSKRKSIPVHLSDPFLSNHHDGNDDLIDRAPSNNDSSSDEVSAKYLINPALETSNKTKINRIGGHVILKEINLTIERGQLVAIVGTVGSGKSSLLSAILGEMKKVNLYPTAVYHEFFKTAPDVINPIISEEDKIKHEKQPLLLPNSYEPNNYNVDGVNDKLKHDFDPNLVTYHPEHLFSSADIRAPTTPKQNPSSTESRILVRGQIAYVAQLPWIRNASFRDNVVFDAPFTYDPEAYTNALECCALIHDRNTVLPDSDDTEIGEKGVNLSGGQKQRLALARAVYRNSITDVYLLDDPLSAVDVHVGRHIFDHVIGPHGILRNKTRVLVTNAIHLLPQVDRILVMKNGRIVEEGTYAELSAKMSGVFGYILKNYLSSMVEEDHQDSVSTPIPVTPQDKKQSTTISSPTDVNVAASSPVLTNTLPLMNTEILPAFSFEPISSSTASPREILSRSDSNKILSRRTSNTSLFKTLNDSSSPCLPLPNSLALETLVPESEKHNYKLPQDDTAIIHSKIILNGSMIKDSGFADENHVKKRHKSTTGEEEGVDFNKPFSTTQKKSKERHQLMTTETSETGRVNVSVYFTYFKAIKYHIFVLVLFLYGSFYSLSIAANFWVSDWTDDKSIIRNGTEYQDIPLRNKRLSVYAIYGALQGLTIIVSTVVLALSMVQASRLLHMKLLRNMLHSPMSFFDSTPLGRIVNRFSKDMDTLDNGLPPNIRSWITTFYGVLTTLIVICISTPWFLASVPPIAIIYFFILKFYIPTSRQLKRLESVARSPIYSHFQETLLGASTIRAFGVSDIFIAESQRLVDANQMCYLPSLISNRWLAIRLELIGSLIVFVSALTVVISRDHIKPGQAGLAISYALAVTQALNWLVRMTCDLETNIVAIERIDEYTNTPTEAPWVIESNRPPKDWPNKGKVEFDHYCLRYRANLAPALKDVSFIAPGEHSVGIVGRTGAGKSSLTVALFRIAEPDKMQTGPPSRILIDDIDITQIGLHDIRSKLTIIPQDPVLFSGTLRFNLDPFNEKSDEEIWESLKNAHLHKFVSKLPQGIDYEIAEYGENLSLGQRQLVCLARALLRNSKILVLDEATAAVDVETDELIQKTIAEKFSHCTLLTIAHRLNTVIDYDRILVLDLGEIAEYDSPQRLLRNKTSAFYKMCLEAGLTSTSGNSNKTLSGSKITQDTMND